MNTTTDTIEQLQEDKDKDKDTDLLTKLMSYIEQIHNENNDLRNKLNEARSMVFKLSSEIDYLQGLLKSRSFGESVDKTKVLHLVVPTRILH